MFAELLAKQLGGANPQGEVPSTALSFAGTIRNQISSVSGSDFFGPQQPLYPVAPKGTQPRTRDYPFAWNLLYRPRSEGRQVSFEQLRWVADSYELLRLCIETRKDQIAKMPYDFILEKQPGEKTSDLKRRQAKDKDLKAVKLFFESPDKENDFATWVRRLLEDMLVIDATSILVRRDKSQNVVALDCIDGASIKPFIDPLGRRPTFPDPSFQQNIKGMPALDLTTQDLIYRPRNSRSHSFYGYPPVEQILMAINIGLRREISQLNFYTSGNVPECLIQCPEDWSTDQIGQMQSYWDDMAGDLSKQRQVRWIPGGKGQTVTFTKDLILKDEFDEWLARICCYALSLPPTPFIKQMNRAVANQVQQTALQEGLIPTQKWIEGIINFILKFHMRLPEVLFKWNDDEEADKLKQAQIDKIYLSCGKVGIDELRERDGEDPLGMPPAMMTPSGPILLKPFIDNPDGVDGAPGAPPPPPPPVVMPPAGAASAAASGAGVPGSPGGIGRQRAIAATTTKPVVTPSRGGRTAPSSPGKRENGTGGGSKAAKGLVGLLEAAALGGGSVADRPFDRGWRY